MEETKHLTIKKSTLYGISILILIIVGGIFLIQTSSADNPTNNFPNNNADAQKVVLSFKNYNYYPNTITVQADKPVSLSLDASVTGCMRFFTIRSLGISKYLKTPQDTLEFTAKKGTYPFACSMGMGTGTLIVE